MSYTINVAGGNQISIAVGATDTSTSLTLVGKNYANYGQLLQQDLVNLLQNWSSSTQPSNPVQGQLWWNSNTIKLFIYHNGVFKTISGSTVSDTAPTTLPVSGDLWFKGNDAQLYVYTGSAWILVGPQSSSSQGKTGSYANSIFDAGGGGPHYILEFWVKDTITGILSKESAFAPSASRYGTTYAGFPTIFPGYNVNQQVFSSNGATLNGVLTTSSQPYITSLGTLTSLTVANPIIGSVLYNAGTVTNASQPNITSLGTLTTLTSSGTITAPLFNGSFNGALGAVTPNSAAVTTLAITARYTESVSSQSASTSATVDWSASSIYNIGLTLSTTTFNFINPPASNNGQLLTLFVNQDATGGRIVTWPANVRWSYAQTPVLTTIPNYRDVFTFITIDGGSTYLGAYSMANVAP
jgi:hypothetical protein